MNPATRNEMTKYILHKLGNRWFTAIEAYDLLLNSKYKRIVSSAHQIRGLLISSKLVETNDVLLRGKKTLEYRESTGGIT